MCNFRVGQKVVCIKGAERSPYTIGGWCPKTGGVYTVRGVYDGPLYLVIHLEEYRHPDGDMHGVEHGWDATRFRPVVERKTDIEIFRRMLNTTPETVGAA